MFVGYCLWCMQMLSRPLLVLSIAEAVSERSECGDETSYGISASHANSESPPEISSVHSPPVTRYLDRQGI